MNSKHKAREEKELEDEGRDILCTGIETMGTNSKTNSY